jgi:hypothetical protein
MGVKEAIMTDKQILQNKAENLTETEIAEVLSYINTLENRRQQASKTDLFDDEIVGTLSEATENRRARIVAEWEKTRRRADSRAAAAFR